MEEGIKEEKILEERQKKVLSFLKEKYNWVFYLILAGLVAFAVWLRSLPMKIRPETGHPGLWDITTNTWTLGPDLDPFLFLRWAKDIIAHGTLMANDALRYVPIGFNVKEELTPLVYMIAWFHKLAAGLGISNSVDYSAVIFPVFMFAITVIAFFFLTRKLFNESLGSLKANIIASIASFFLIVCPPLLARTIAGIPEKESAAFFFLFITFYLFISAWKAKSLRKQVILAVLSGITTAAMAGVWGGYTYIFLTLGIGLFISFILGKISRDKLFISIIWIVSSLLIMGLMSSRYSLGNLVNSTVILIPLSIIIIASIHEIIFSSNLKKYFENSKISKIPKPIISILLVMILGFIASLALFGPGFIYDKFVDVGKPLISPVTDRLGVTVAENRQPYFAEWANSFGPFIGGKMPIFFWLFFIGSIYLYSFLMRILTNKERIIATISYVLFLFAIIYSRYAPNSIFNGTNFISIGFYIAGVLALAGCFGYYYYQYFKKDNLDIFKTIDFGLILLFSFFFFGLISARGSVRTIMVMVPPASIIVAFLVTDGIAKLSKIKNENNKIIAWLIILALFLFSAYSGYAFYMQSKSMSYNYIPSAYTQQWQLAMSWVRENTQENAVFGHWWDYGYWVQTMGERATVLDGGNAISYWDHLMGRYALTSPSNTDALEFLFAHNTTHFLIDSTDIGKYGAFSSIGSDVNYDRASFIPNLVQDKQQTREGKNSTIYVYQAGFATDSDIIYTLNGTKIFLPGGKSGIKGILIEKSKDGKLTSNPIAVINYQNKDYNIPLRYAYYKNNLTDFGTGIESGIFLFPAVIQSGTGYTVEKDYALLYLSDRTVKSQLARLYLYKEDNPNFILVHSEDDFVVSTLKEQKALSENEDFVYYQGLRGPIRIWEITYPENITFKEEFLEKTWTSAELQYGSR